MSDAQHEWVNHDIAPPFYLGGKRALVTGASRGLGRHFARTLARAGADVVVAARGIESLSEFVNELRSFGIAAQAVSLDVTDAESIKHTFNAIETTGRPADIIVNNAGMTVTKPLLDLSEDDWDRVLATNLRGSWLVAQEGSRRLVNSGMSGSIINIASILGERVSGQVAPYCAAKAGLIHATKAAALELARYDIRVNSILPGYIVTDLNREFLAGPEGERMRHRIPTRRFGQPAHLDGALLLFASAAGAHITGVALPVDGGHLISPL